MGTETLARVGQGTTTEGQAPQIHADRKKKHGAEHRLLQPAAGIAGGGREAGATTVTVTVTGGEGEQRRERWRHWVGSTTDLGEAGGNEPGRWAGWAGQWASQVARWAGLARQTNGLSLMILNY
jgi:hypothetical protein